MEETTPTMARFALGCGKHHSQTFQIVSIRLVVGSGKIWERDQSYHSANTMEETYTYCCLRVSEEQPCSQVPSCSLMLYALKLTHTPHYDGPLLFMVVVCMLFYLCVYTSHTLIKMACSCTVLAAGESFKRAAEIHMELETKHESASNLCEAAQVLKREDPRGRSD